MFAEVGKTQPLLHYGKLQPEGNQLTQQIGYLSNKVM